MKAEKFRTPAAKRKRDPLTMGSDDDAVMVESTRLGRYARMLPENDFDLERLIEKGVQRGVITKIVAGVESSSVNMNEGIEEVALFSRDRFAATGENTELIMGNLQSLKARIGSVPRMDSRFTAPTLWGSTSSVLAGKVLRIEENIRGLSDSLGPIGEIVDIQTELKKKSGDTSVEVSKVIQVMSAMMKKLNQLLPEVEAVKTSVSNLMMRNITDGDKGLTSPSAAFEETPADVLTQTVNSSPQRSQHPFTPLSTTTSPIGIPPNDISLPPHESHSESVSSVTQREFR